MPLVECLSLKLGQLQERPLNEPAKKKTVYIQAQPDDKAIQASKLKYATFHPRKSSNDIDASKMGHVHSVDRGTAIEFCDASSRKHICWVYGGALNEHVDTHQYYNHLCHTEEIAFTELSIGRPGKPGRGSQRQVGLRYK